MSENKKIYGASEVLRRGIPGIEYRTLPPIAATDDPINNFKATYANWLRSHANITDIQAAYGKLFVASEAVFGNPLYVDKINDLNTPSIMSGVIGGDVELGFMELFHSWTLRRQERAQFQRSTDTRLGREARRTATMLRAGQVAIDEPDYRPSLESKKAMGSYQSSVSAEGVRLAMQLVNLATLRSLSAHKTGPPNRGIKDVGTKISALSLNCAIASELIRDCNDKEVRENLSGAILECEAFILLLHASGLNFLDKAWPIASSQRLDFGWFRQNNDTSNTDIICLFPNEDLAVPVQVHTGMDQQPGEAQMQVVLHRKDLYPFHMHPKEARPLGSIALGFLGEPGGASRDYIDTRATFVASKLNSFASRVVDPSKHGIFSGTRRA